VESSRAKNQSDISKATIIAFLITLCLYILISMLSFGILPQSALAKASNPSMAAVLAQAVGPWGALVTNIGLIISLTGAWLGWTLLCVQLPFDSAKDNSMPKLFAQQNKHNSPANALWLSNGLIQLFLIVVLFSHGTYLSLLKLSTSCILVPYLLCALYALKLRWCAIRAIPSETLSRVDGVILLASIYALWLLVAAGIHYLLLSFILYAIGIVFFAWARIEANKNIFTSREWLTAIIIVGLATSALLTL